VGQQAAPAVQDSLEKQIQGIGAFLAVACASVAALCPGVLLGAAATAVWRWLQRPPLTIRLVCAAVPLTLLLPLHALLQVGWLWRDVFANSLPAGTIKGVDGSSVARSVAVEILAGPLVLEVALFARMLVGRSLGAQIRRDQRSDRRRLRAVAGRRQLHSLLPDPHGVPSDDLLAHPPGGIRLGVDRESHRPFDLELPRDLATHVFLPGVSGSGKTNTLTRLADGVLANGYGVVVVDCKGGDLRDTARALAARHRIPFFLVDPDESASLGYNPCSGDASAVANKLVGAFSYGPSAEIYKNIAMEAIPVIARGLLAAGEDVTLEALYAACGARGMVRIAQRIPDGLDDRVRARLLTLGGADDDRLAKSGYKGLQRRFGALLEGKFGDLFRAETTLDWNLVGAQPSVTYIALSTLATSEDVELMGRVIAQDLKQVCATRLKMLSRGAMLAPVLAIFDEFAALREADQLSDLLRQARQALMPVVVSTQYIPETVDLRKSVLGAGLLLCHRVESEDANALAEALGTWTRTELTNQLDFETGYTQKGTIKQVEAYSVHPNVLRSFTTGYVAARSITTKRHAIVQVHRAPA
jgi:hypothetical protein